MLAVFLFMETAGQSSALAVTAQGGSLGTSSQAGKASLSDWLRLLPPETARVESVRDSESAGPFVVLLQDAHSNPQAQRNIARVLEYLAARQSESGGKLFVAVEGARGDLHPEYFDFFPEFTEAGDAVVESLLEKGELSGTELFAWSRYKQNKENAAADTSVVFRGVETTSLYRDNLAAYRGLLNSRAGFSGLLESAESSLQSQISQNLNPELVRFYKERAKRKNGQFGLRRKDAGQGDLSIYADYLKTQSETVLGIQLEDPVEQLRFPNFVRLLKLKSHQGNLRSLSSSQAWEKFYEQLAALPEAAPLAAAFLKLGSDYGISGRVKEDASPTGLEELSPRKLLEGFEKLEGLSWKEDASLVSALKAIVLQSEIDTTFLFEEMNRLESGVFEALARTPEEKKWVRKIQDFEELKRLLYLEMTREDLDRVKTSRPDFSALLSGLVEEKDEKTLSALAGKAMTFYRQARERDDALVLNALEFFRSGEPSVKPDAGVRPLLVLVSGGFHAEGIQEVLRGREMDFALVTPRITETDQGQRYARVMSGENAKLEAYFKIEQPFSTKQEALLFREAMETAIPRWLERWGSDDEAAELFELFSRHPVLSRAVRVAEERDPSPVFVFTPQDSGNANQVSNSAISTALLSADAEFNRAVDRRPAPGRAEPYRWKSSRTLTASGAPRAELRQTETAEQLENRLLAEAAVEPFAKAVEKLDSQTREGVKTLQLLARRVRTPDFIPQADALRTRAYDAVNDSDDEALKRSLLSFLNEPGAADLLHSAVLSDETGAFQYDADLGILTHTADYDLSVLAEIDTVLSDYVSGNFSETEGALRKLLHFAEQGFEAEVRERLKASQVREFEQFRILIELLNLETGFAEGRSELRSAEKPYEEALQFTSRPVVTNLGDSSRVEITFKTDAATLEKSEMFFHWGDYNLGPLDWTDHEILNWDIDDLGGGVYRASKIIQPGRIGEFGVTAYAQHRVTGQRVWQGKTRNDDAVIRIDLPEKTVLEDLRRNLKKQEAIERIRQSLVAEDPYNRYIETIYQLAAQDGMRGMGKIVYDAVKDVPRLGAVLGQVYERLKNDSLVWNKVYKERALPALQSLETLGVGEIVFIAPEGPHAIAGGLAKVIEGLAKALSESGVSVTVITPLYEDNQGKKHSSAETLIANGFTTEGGSVVSIKPEPISEIGMTFGPMYDSGTHLTGLTDDKIRTFRRTVQSRVYEANADGVRYLFLRHPRLADKLYAKVPSSEELRRAVFLSRAALEVVQNRALGVDPQLMISNDWVTGLIPVLLERDPRYSKDPMLQNVGTVHMIHNYGRDYQGRVFTNQYGLDLWPLLGLDNSFYQDVADPNDDRFLNITSSAMGHVNRSILTVSRPYAEQMLTPEAGEGLDTILNPLKDVLFGVSNGIDEAAARKTFWQKGEESRAALGLAPLLGEYSDEGFLANLWDYKNAALIKTQRDFGFTEDPDAVFLSMIGRVAEQKGIQLLTETENGVTVLESLLQMNPKVQLFLGGPVAEGDTTAERLRDLTLDLQSRYPGRIRGEFTFVPGATTLQVMLGSRFFLMPSRYEPGGITQLESLAAGTPVIARNVGGIAATLINFFDNPAEGNGFLFTDFTGAALRDTLAGAIAAVAGDPGLLKTLSNRAATAQNDWHDRIPQYLSLLQGAAGVLRPQGDSYVTDYSYLAQRPGILNDLRPRNRSELRSEGLLSSPQFDLKVSQYVANLDAQRRNRDGLNDADYLDESLREFLLPLTELIGVMSRDPEQAWRARRFLTDPDQRELARRFAAWVQDRIALKAETSDDNALEADLIAAGQEALWVVMVAYIDSNLFSPVRKIEKLPVTLHFDAETLESYFAGNRKLLPSPSPDEPAVTDLWFVYDPHIVFGLVGSHRERGLPPHAKGGIRFISPVNADGDYLNLRLYMSLFRDPTGRNVAQQGVVVDLFDLVRAQETKNMLGTEFHGAKAEYTYFPGSEDAAAFKKFAAAFLDAGILDHEVPGPDIGMSGDKVQSGVEEAKRIALRHLSREVEYLGLLVSDSVPGENDLALLGMTAEQLQGLRNLFKTTFPDLKDPMLVYEKTLPMIESYSSVRFLQSRIHRLLRMYLLRDYFQGTKLGDIPVYDSLSASTDELALKFYAAVDNVRQSSEDLAEHDFRRDYRPSKSPAFTQILDKVMGAVVTGGASEKGAIDHVVSAITAKGVYNAYLRTRDYLVKKGRLEGQTPVRLAFNGAGDVGGSAAMMAARGGDLVVMMQDVNGAVYSKKGFSVQKLQEFNNIPPAKRNVVEFFGRIPGAIPLNREKMFSGDQEFEFDVIVTAATANTINESNVENVIRSGLKAIIEGGNNTYKNVAARLAQAGVITAWGSTANIGGVIASSHENQAKHRFTVSELTLPTLQSLPDGKLLTATLTGHHTTVPLSRVSSKAPERKVRSTIELQDDRVIKPSTAFPDLPLNTLVDLVEVSQNGETVWKAYVNNMEVGEVDSGGLVQRLRFLVDGETNHVEVRGGEVASANPAFPELRPGPVRVNYPVRDRKYETYQFVGDVINAYQTVVLALVEPGNPEMDSIKVQRALSRALAEKKKEIFLSEAYREKREKAVRELIDSGYVAAPEEMLHLVSARLAREEMLSFTKSSEGVLEFVETVNPFTGERIRVSRDFEILPTLPGEPARAELRAEDVNPYTLEENVTRGFAQLDEMHGGRIRTSLNSRIAAGSKPRVLLIGVGRGVVSADILREYGDKIELYSTAKEDLLFSPEQLEEFWEGKVSAGEAAALISTIKDRYAISDAEKDLGVFDSLSFDVIVITQTVMQYIKNKPGLVARLAAKLSLQGELMTDFDVFSIKDSATGSSVDIKAFFESLGPDYEAYGITLGKTQAPISLLAGLRFTRSSEQINEIPLDATANSKVYHLRRSELRSEKGNPYILEENVTRGFRFLDEMHGGRVTTAISTRIEAGQKPKVLLLGVGRGVVPAELIRIYGDKAEFFSSGAEDLLFSAEELSKFMEGLSLEEASVIAESIKGRFAVADLNNDLSFFEGSTFDVVIMTQAVMEYMRNIPAVIERLSERLNVGGELITDLDIMSIRDPDTDQRIDTKAFFEGLSPDFEVYGITLGGEALPIDFYPGLRFKRSSEKLFKLPLDVTRSSKTYTAQRSELRAEQVSPPQNVRLNGVSPEMLKVEAGELVFWRPSQRQMNTSLKRPYDDEATVIQKIMNERKTLDTLWMQVLGELQERSYSSDALDVVDIMIRRTMELIAAQEIKAEVALQTVKEEMLAAAKEDSGDELDLTTAAGIVEKRLLPALENREELIYVESGLDAEARRKLFIDRERDQILAKIFEIILRLPYGLHISPEDYGQDEKDRVMKLISLERQIADGRRSMLINDLLPEILKIVEQGKRAQFAINQVIKIKIEPGLERLKKMMEDNRKSGGDTLVGSRLIKIFEEQRSLLEGIRDEFDTYDFIYDSSDLPAERDRKRLAELERFEAVYKDTLLFFPDPSESLKAFLGELRTRVTYEIRERGRTLDYGVAKFFSQKGSERYKDLPTDQLDFLMRFYNVSQYGIVKRGGDKNLVVFAEKIRHEADFAELMMKNKGRGKVVSIATLKRFAPEDAPGRVPHWFIFSKDQGIVPVEALDFEDRKRDFKELKDGDFVLVDGKKGIAIVNPNPETQRDMIERGKVYKYLDEYFLPRVSLPALVNGRPFYFWADESRLDYLKRDGDQPRFQKFGARGVGLLRLEQLMGEMDRAGIEFDEMRLSLAIEEMLLPFSDPEAPLTIRLYDVQGDKRPKFFVEGKSEEQIEGILKTHSNIRFYLDEREEFRDQREFGKMQIKAIYRAYLRAQKNNLQILLPNLLKIEEVAALKKLFDEARQELLRELEEEALIQVEAAVVRRHGWVSGIDALETEALEKGLDWFRNQLLNKPEMKDRAEQFGQESDADYARTIGADFGERTSRTLSKIRFGYMFEEVSAVEQRVSIMKAVLEQHQDPAAKPFFGIGTNDLQKSVLESRDESNDEMNKLHPGLVKAIADLEGASRELGLHLTVEGQWGGSARMLFAAMALEIYHGRKMQLVAPTNKIPELLEMIRMTEPGDLEYVFDLGPSYKPASMKTLIDRMEAGDLPELDEMNLVATMLQDRIEAKVVASSDFQTFRNLKERQELIARSELRDLNVETVSATAAFKKEVVLGASDRISILGVSGFDESVSAVTAVSRELDGLYFGPELVSALPDRLTVRLSRNEKTFDVPTVQAIRLWVAHQVAVENGLFESSEVTDPELLQMLSSIDGLPSKMPEDQGEAGFSASIHVQLEEAPELNSLLPVLAVAVSVNGAFHLNIDSMNEEQAGEFEKAIRELAASKTLKFKPGQMQVKGSLLSGIFATVPQAKFNERDKHALIGKEDVFKAVHKRRGQNLFSLDPAAVKNSGLFASTLITVLQAMALGKQPEEYFQVLDPRSLDPDHFADLLQAVTTYLSAQVRIQTAA